MKAILKITAILTFLCVSLQVLPCHGQWIGLVMNLAGGGKHCHKGPQEPPDVLYEMVPHVVLPETIQYKPMPMNPANPGQFVGQTNYPATYIAYPSYSLPYPSTMRSVGQAVYPVTPGVAPGTPVSAPEYRLNEEKVQEPEERAEPIVLAQYSGTPEYRLNGGGNSAVRPLGASPAYDAQGVQTMPPKSDVLGPAHVIAAVPQNQNVPGMAPGAGAAYMIKPSPVPPYAPYNALAADPSTQQGNRNAQNAPTQQQLEDAKRQVQQMLQSNPNLQLSAITVGQDGRVIPLNLNGSPVSQPYPQNVPAPNASPEANVNLYNNPNWQADYIQKANRYVNQIGAAPNPPQLCNQVIPPYPGAPNTAQAPYAYTGAYLQPVPNMPGMYMMVNPYYGAIHGTSGMYAAPQQTQLPQYGVSPYAASPYAPQQYAPQQPVGYYVPGYGVMLNPYYPMPQQQFVPQDSRKGEDYKPMRTRIKEKRLSKEKELCDAWRAPHYPPNTAMRLPSKDAYPWGYFGAHGGYYQTPNFGGYHDLYYGHSTTPGQ